MLPEAAVGPRQANRPADVIGAKRLLSALGAYRFDPGEEPSNTAGPGLVEAVERFQSDHDLEPDGVMQPGGPTLRAMAAEAFPGEGLEDRVTRAAVFNPHFEAKRRKEAEAKFAAFKAASMKSGETSGTAQPGDAQGAERPTPFPDREPSMGGEGLILPPIVDTPRIIDPPGRTPVDMDEWIEILKFDPDGIGLYDRAVRDPVGAAGVKALADQAEEMTAARFPGQPDRDNHVDAFRHALWSYLVTKSLGPAVAKRWLESNEITRVNRPGSRMMDLFNNAIGRELAMDPKNQNRPPEEVVAEALRDGLLQREPFALK